MRLQQVPISSRNLIVLKMSCFDATYVLMPIENHAAQIENLIKRVSSHPAILNLAPAYRLDRGRVKVHQVGRYPPNVGIAAKTVRDIAKRDAEYGLRGVASMRRISRSIFARCFATSSMSAFAVTSA
ncbi:hypothetical protein [Rhizobium leguminosarum]|uniref:hypothetical protein n=1 Tax=Rhizobium leguminosarum TaxID=384 RepID=UPI0005695DDD|nr:hypothetical protein [Rhizobium leguminosarum]